MTPHAELFEVAEKLKKAAAAADGEDVVKPICALEDAVQKIGRSFSGSWLGYHAYVYYADFSPPPPGVHFSQDSGLMDPYEMDYGSGGDWREHDPEVVEARILEMAGEPDLQNPHKAAEAASKTFELAKAEIISILQGELDVRNDGFLENLKKEVEKLNPVSKSDVVRHLNPKGRIFSGDTLALGQGIKLPPHISLVAEVKAIRHAFAICHTAGNIATKAASHLERKARKSRAAERVGTNVFIGHGRSHVWRDLKDFLQDRLKLPWDEFNRVPVAGGTNVARLSEMLDAAAIAFVVMTAEDETIDGKLQARMNVVHETGLFQGRLGFNKAVLMLEEPCEQFNNIEGLGQIRFPSGNISAAFEQVRRVLEREGLIETN